jgi:hemoglobin-like flavoprotein/NO-binding membrane sensor protein with MHYT domain
MTFLSITLHICAAPRRDALRGANAARGLSVSATFDPLLVVLSISVAVLGAVSALSLTAQPATGRAPPWQRFLALGNGALTLGATIWSARFIASKAVQFPGLANFSFLEALLSFGIAVVAAGAGLALTGMTRLRNLCMAVGGLIVGLGIGGMAYLKFWQTPDCGTGCDPNLVMTIGGIVLLAAAAGVWMAFHQPGMWWRMAGGFVLGFAIALMSYAAMLGTYVVSPRMAVAETAPRTLQELLPYIVAGGMLMAIVNSMVLRAMISKDSLTREQIALVQETFRQVEDAGPDVADLFYDRLFEIAPETRRMFPVNLASQKGKLLAVLAGAVLSLHKIDEVMPVLKDLGRRHIHYGVEPAHYEVAGEALLWSLARILGDDFTPAVKKAWTTAYTTLADVMIAAAAEAEAAHR